MRRLLAAAPVVLRDVAGLAGIAVTAYGAWLIYVPAGFITGGLMIVVAAVAMAVAEARPPQ